MKVQPVQLAVGDPMTPAQVSGLVVSVCAEAAVQRQVIRRADRVYAEARFMGIGLLFKWIFDTHMV